jgi:hypothetical protein
MNYCTADFKTCYLDFDFDDILHEQDNQFVNNDEYLKYKNIYKTKTLERMNQIKQFNLEYDILNNYYTKTDNNKYIYNIVDKSSTAKYNILIKNIIQEQKSDYTNFIQYIHFLNKIVKEPIPQIKITRNIPRSKN